MKFNNNYYFPLFHKLLEAFIGNGNNLFPLVVVVNNDGFLVGIYIYIFQVVFIYLFIMSLF